MFGDKMWCQSWHRVRNFIDSKTYGKQGLFLLRIYGVGFVVLCYGDYDVALIARTPRNLDVELGVHCGRFCVLRSSPGVVAPTPSSPGKNSSPGLFRVQSWLQHPIIRTHMDQIELREMPSKVFKRHPKLSVVRNSNTKELLVSGWKTVPFPGPFAPRTSPLSSAPRVSQSNQWGFTGSSSNSRQPCHAVSMLCYQAVAKTQLSLALLLLRQ